MFKKLCFICIYLLFAGCTSSQSLTFDVSTQDHVEVILQSPYDLKTDKDAFLIYDANLQKVAEGIFLPKETYESLLKEKSQIEVIEEDFHHESPYFLAKIDNNYVYVLFLDGSQTGIMLTCTTSKSQAKQIFNNLDFKILENS